MKQLTTLYLVIHPIPRNDSTRREYMKKWEQLIREQGPVDDQLICLLSNAPAEMQDLIALARQHFGGRCISDPNDESTATKVLLAEDMEKTMKYRGSFGAWHPYELWSSNNARRWTEGLKKTLHDLGFQYDPARLNLVSFGQQWGGCLTKYSSFMAKYLGVETTPDVRADLSPDAGWPYKAVFRERIEMDRHVYLFLFEMADGRPMGQYFDSLRTVWEPPHRAHVELDTRKLEIINTSPNGRLRPEGAADITATSLTADVGDGCHPDRTTIIGTEMDYSALRNALMNAEITPRQDRCSLQYAIGYLDPVTTSRDD